uniref:START domain-containing protein n=1 Tax=Heterorhabditis bacteriophora TaxID=37862 RepID=A0A1I7XJU2_HETBA
MSGRDPLLVSESVGIGKDRRKFIIISIFDASLNVLLWLLCTVLFFFSHKQGGLPQYLLVVSSFSIAWFELWLMPFKVLPRERRCEHFDSFASHDDVVSVRDRRSPSDPVSVSRSRVVGVLPRNSNNRHFSDDDFRSAVEYTSGLFISLTKHIFLQKWVKYSTMLKFGLIFSLGKRDLESGKSYKVLTHHITFTRNLNVLLLFYSMLHGKTFLNGILKLWNAGDFVDVRRIRLDSAALIYSGIFVSVESTISPANEKVTRGHNGPSVIRVIGGDSANEACLEWIMRTDLRGGLPKRLVQCSMLSYFIEHISRLREYVERQSIAES